MRITVRLFAILRERSGQGEIAVDLPGDSSVASALDNIAVQFPEIRDYLPRVAFAVNREYVSRDAILHDGDELALIPPVSGG